MKKYKFFHYRGQKLDDTVPLHSQHDYMLYPHPALRLRSVGTGSVRGRLVLQDVFDAELVALQSLAVTEVRPEDIKHQLSSPGKPEETYV